MGVMYCDCNHYTIITAINMRVCPYSPCIGIISFELELVLAGSIVPIVNSTHENSIVTCH